MPIRASCETHLCKDKPRPQLQFSSGQQPRRQIMTSLTLDNTATAPRPDHSRTTGALAAFGAVLIWAAWIVGTRQAVTHALDPYAIGFLRFTVPGIVFAPVWWRSGLRPRGVSYATMLGLMGAGAPFFVTVAMAMRHATAAEIGPLLT